MGKISVKILKITRVKVELRLKSQKMHFDETEKNVYSVRPAWATILGS